MGGGRTKCNGRLMDHCKVSVDGGVQENSEGADHTPQKNIEGGDDTP